MRSRLVALLLLASVALSAEGISRTRPGKKRWWASVAALAAASVLDIHSSWRRREINPMLRGPEGRFGARGLVIKSSILGASCGVQWMLLDKEPRRNGALVGMNAGLAAWSATAAARNHRN
jgi:hypothetical protein